MEKIKLQSKNICIFMIVVLIGAVTLYALLRPNRQAERTPVTEVETSTDFDSEERDDTWDEMSASTIVLNGASAELKGEGVTYQDNVITITKSGTYVVSGSSENLQIKVSANKDRDHVKLVLNGVSMTHENSAPINIQSADKTILTLAKGSVNTLEDGLEYLLDTGSDEPSGAVFSKDDLVINGTGTLRVMANYNHGIVSKDDLKIASGTFEINAVNDAIKGKDSVRILNGNFNLEAGGDGIQASNDTDVLKGYVAITNGVFKIIASGDGIQAETTLEIHHGEFSIETLTNRTESSDKGIKSGGDMVIHDGAFIIDSQDDAFHANGNLTIESGSYTLSTLDDGMHADGDLRIKGGDINILESYEGLEGSSVYIDGGSIRLVAQDDGINAAGGQDTKDQFRTTGDHRIEINGGTVVVNAQGDGLDSNGDLFLKGGDVIVNGPEGDGDASLDYDGVNVITGGRVVAGGSSGMMGVPDSTSSQPSLQIVFSTKQNVNSNLSLVDEDGESVLEFNAIKSYQAVLFSDATLEIGKTYLIYQDDSLLTEVTLSNHVTTIDETGNARNAQQNGPGGGRPNPGSGGQMRPGI